MDNDNYFKTLSEDFDKAYTVAKSARSRGIDPKDTVEIYPAPDLASRVEGLINIKGIADIIKKQDHTLTKSKLAFKVVEEICKDSQFDNYETIKRMELAVRVGTAILTDGVLVAPTEGISGIKRWKNPDGTDYISILYAGPIRGAGGTAAAQSVALADFARRIFNISQYKPTQDEIERYVEEAELYDSRAARLQYKPSDDDLRVIVSNCPVCVDGVPTESTLEIGVHANLNRTTYDGKVVPITNKVRGGVPLVLCEGIAQKAKKLVKEVKSVGLDWDWLNRIIKVDVKKTEIDKDHKISTFLDELVAGRPILAYPNYVGGFRLRYGRSRYTGIAAKGFSPATMILTMGFIAVGTQLKMDSAGKGCIASPVDSIEGPFIRLKNGNAMRVNDAETAMKYKDEVERVLAIGDILITYGDFRKSNSQLKPTSYVEEYWANQLKDAGHTKPIPENISFEDAYSISLKHGVPMHPKYLYEFQAIDKSELSYLSLFLVRNAKVTEKTIFEIKKIKIPNDPKVKNSLEVLNVTHSMEDGAIIIEEGYVQSLLASLGFASGEQATLAFNELVVDKYGTEEDEVINILNKVAPFKIMKRSTYIAARIGRPEKAKERLMKPAPNVLFPIGSYGGPSRNVTSAYVSGTKKFKSDINVEIANYKCTNCRRTVASSYCYDCNRRAVIERWCQICNRSTMSQTCEICKGETIAYSKRDIDLTKMVTEINKRLGGGKMPNIIKGVKGMTNKDKCTEPLEKGILRANNGVYIFKDGTARFDATDVPITHFYPEEIGVSIEKLRELGYTKDYQGAELERIDQLVEMRHQDVILNVRGGEYMLKVSNFIDQMLLKLYGIEPFYSAKSMDDMIGKLVITLSPHTSCGVLGRIIGFTKANVGLAHPYTISARRRNCDGDEDTTMLLLDALINFSREYLPQTVGGMMDTPLILTLNLHPEEVDDEVHAMEAVENYGTAFYDKTFNNPYPSEVRPISIEDRLGKQEIYSNLYFTHGSSKMAIANSPKRSTYTMLKTMQEKLDSEFKLMEMLQAVDINDAARKVIMSHFIPDLIGNLHSFSRQIFRCSSCNAKYRRIPLAGICQRDGGKLLLTISKGSIEKYLEVAITLAEKYELDNYIRQRLYLIKSEIKDIFADSADAVGEFGEKQFSLLKFV